MLNNLPPPLLEHRHKDPEEEATATQHPLFANPQPLPHPSTPPLASIPDMVSIFANHLKQQQQQQQQHQPLSLVKMPSPSASSNSSASSTASSSAQSQSRVNMSGPLRSAFSIRSILEEKEESGNNNNKGRK